LAKNGGSEKDCDSCIFSYKDTCTRGMQVLVAALDAAPDVPTLDADAIRAAECARVLGVVESLKITPETMDLRIAKDWAILHVLTAAFADKPQVGGS
jgi:hypothetical protein